MMNGIVRLGLYVVTLGVVSCGGEHSNTVRDAARESLPGNTKQVPVASTPNVPSAAAAGVPGAAVFHYICPNNCAGSGGDVAGTCPVCGTEYMHNQAYHAQQTQNTGTSSSQQVTVPGNTANGAPGTNPPQVPEPAQNAAGVWHYTCPNGCAGGAGTAGTCATCGGALAHNSAYHQ